MGFNLGGIAFSFDFWFFALLALFAALSPAGLIFYFILPAMIHELGHIAAILCTGAKIKAVRFSAFGVDMQKSRLSKRGIGRECFVCLGGILANLIVAAILFVAAFKSMRMLLFISANLAVAAFNLLPIGSLDGGELARAVSEYFFKPRLAFVLSRVFSFAALVPLFAAAIFLLLLPERNFTLLAVCAYLLADILTGC